MCLKLRIYFLFRSFSELPATFFRFWTFNHRMSLGWSFLNLFFLTDWFQYRPQRRYHFEWDASSWTWQVCRGSYWNKWPGSEGVLSGEGVYGILVKTDFCFTTADTTWLHYDWYLFPKFAVLTSMRLGEKGFFEYNKLIILSPIQCCQYDPGIPATMVVGLRGVNHTESGKDHFWPYKIQCLFLGNLS